MNPTHSKVIIMSFNFDLAITGHSFHMTDGPSEPINLDSALSRLKKIQEVLQRQLIYDQNQKDHYANKTQFDLFVILKERSTEIYAQYKTAQPRPSWMSWALRLILKPEIEIVQSKIDNFTPKPTLFDPIPNELLYKIAMYLETADLLTLVRLIPERSQFTKNIYLSRVQKLGYIGNDIAEAAKYKNELYSQINKCAVERIIPNDYLIYENNQLILDKTINRLKNLSTPDLYKFLSVEFLYIKSYQNIRRIFNTKGNWRIEEVNDERIKKLGKKALKLSIDRPKDDCLSILLEHNILSHLSPEEMLPVFYHAAHIGDTHRFFLLKSKLSQLELEVDYISNALVHACGSRQQHSGKCHHIPNIEIVDNLLKLKANPFVSDRIGNYPIHYAAELFEETIITKLINNGANFNQENYEGATPLTFACGYKSLVEIKNHQPNPRLVELLLKCKADPNVISEGNNYPIHYAAKGGNDEILSLLINYGALFDAKNVHRETPLRFACDRNFKRCSPKSQENSVRILLESKAAPNSMDHVRGYPIRYAAQSQLTNTVKLLITHQASIHSVDNRGLSALECASGCNVYGFKQLSIELMTLLLENQANPNSSTNRTFPLHIAARAGDATIVNQLLKYKAEPNVVNERNITPLHIACRRYRFDAPRKLDIKVIDHLLDQKANPNASDDRGASPLHYAAQSGLADAVEKFLLNGADINAKNHEGETALTYALKSSESVPILKNLRVFKVFLLHSNPILFTYQAAKSCLEILGSYLKKRYWY